MLTMKIGPFPTEQITETGEENEIGQKLQSIGAEFGATTGSINIKSLLDRNMRPG